jgi:hypothetical protein
MVEKISAGKFPEAAVLDSEFRADHESGLRIECMCTADDEK